MEDETMIKTALITAVAAATLAAATLSASAASAQYAPMDMSGMIARQMQVGAQGDMMAMQAGQQAYQYLAWRRAMGYPVNETLAIGNHPNDFNNGWGQRSNATTNAIEDNTIRSVQGCYRYQTDARGWTYRVYVC
jgi:hypothetical protein